MIITAVAHDPGGANVVAATVAALRSRGAVVHALAYGPAVRQFHQLGVACIDGSAEGRAADPSAVTRAAEAAPEKSLEGTAAVLVGTSSESVVELEAIERARARGVPSIAAIDAWSNPRSRFEREGSAPRFPDHVIVLDDENAAALHTEGVPSKTHVLGSAWFAWLLRERLGGGSFSAPARRVLFASQPAVDGNAGADVGLAMVVDALRTSPAELVVRFHPRQLDRATALEILRHVRHAIDDEVDAITSVRGVDCVIGVSTTLLVDAALSGRPTMSVLLDPFAARLARLGFVTGAHGIDDVIAFLRAPTMAALAPDVLRMHEGADARAAELVLALAGAA